MSHKVDISEVTDFSTDLEDASSNVRSSLDKIQDRVEAVNNMDSFTGKAADEARKYFTDLHLTLLESFRGLFDDLEENLKQHIKAFGSEVDASESAIIESNYLQDIKEDINELFESLKDQDESISDTISDVSDITSASTPDISDAQEYKKHSIEKLEEVDEDLEEFTGKNNEVDVEAIIAQIEAVMSKATTSTGKARFADFKGASDIKDLEKLQGYNDSKQENLEEELESLNSEAKASLEMAKADYENGNIDKTTFEAIAKGLINGGNGFLTDLINNKETNTLGNVDVEKVYEWGQNYREVYVDPQTLLQEQENLTKFDQGGFETEALWNINVKLNGYMYEQVIAEQTNNEADRLKAEEKEKELREQYDVLSEYLIEENEFPHAVQEPLELENEKQLNYRIDGEGYLHYKAEEGYYYYEENHKQSTAEQVTGVLGKTGSSIVVGLPFGGIPATIGGITGFGSEILGNHSYNVLYVPAAGEVKTMIYREDIDSGKTEQLIIDSEGDNINNQRGWRKY